MDVDVKNKERRWTFEVSYNGLSWYVDCHLVHFDDGAMTCQYVISNRAKAAAIVC